MNMGGKVSRNVSNNEELSSPSFIMSPCLVKQICIQGYPGGKQRCFWRDQHLLCGPEGIENGFRELR